LEQGRLSSGGAGHIDAVGVFAGGSKRQVKNIPLEEVRGGHSAVIEYINRHITGESQIFVADAVTDEDLEIIFRAYRGMDKPLVLAGSAGLANHISRDIGKKNFCKPLEPMPDRFLKKDDSVLVVAGTRQGETAAQLKALSQGMSVPIIRFNVDLAGETESEDAVNRACHEAAEQMRGNARLCIVAVESMFRQEIPSGGVDGRQVEGDKTGEAISQALGNLTRKLFDDFQFSVVISTGGDTSLGICRQLEIEGIEPLAEICPGIPIGKIAGGVYKGRYIITKSGRFGDRGALLEIMNYVGLT
jgi:uncharacterized protein YgbK (DUF1537 family)